MTEDRGFPHGQAIGIYGGLPSGQLNLAHDPYVSAACAAAVSHRDNHWTAYQRGAWGVVNLNPYESPVAADSGDSSGGSSSSSSGSRGTGW